MSIKRTVKNEKDFTNVLVKARGDITKEDIDIELEKLFSELDIDKENSDINIDMIINN